LGTLQNFNDIFPTAGASELIPKTFPSTYFASEGIDVWSIDLAWTRLSGETTDFDFMQDYGIDRHANDLLEAMSFARLIRGLTKNGFGGINLLDFSYGVGVAYMAASLETQKSWFFRSIKGLVTADGPLKYDPADLEGLGVANPQPLICGPADFFSTLLANGTLGASFPP